MENRIMITRQQAAAVYAPMNAQTLLNEFIDYIAVQDITKNSYIVCLRCFAEWLHDNGIEQPQRKDILNYARFLAEPHARRQRADRPSSTPAPVITFTAGTQARYLRAVKMVFKWAFTQGKIPYNPAENVKGAKCRADNRKRDALQKQDARQLLDSIDRSTPAGKRDFAMILLSITAALRIVEMQRATIGNLETVAGEKVLFIHGKGRAEADEYKKLTPEVDAAILDYLATRSTHDPAAPLFAGIGNRSREMPLTEPSISRIIKERLKAAGYDTHRLSAHSLRHTSVTFLLESGATLQEAQQHARHAAPVTTEIYAHNLDRKHAHTEQRIYDFLFDRKKDPAAAAADCMRRMNAAQQARALELLQAISGC